MIARYWSGRVRATDVDVYVDYVRRTGIAGQRATPGNLGSMMMVSHQQDEAEVVVMSLWESLDAVRKFAGEPVDQAIFYPEDERYLIAADPMVRHYEVPAYAVDGDAVRAQAAIPDRA